MTHTATLILDEEHHEFPVVVGTEDEHAIDIRDPARPDGIHHARSRLRQHRQLRERHHLHRRREGHPALPRHPHRAVRREPELRRSRPGC